MSVFLGYLTIFMARVIDVSMGTIRTIMVVQGRKTQAALIGFFEIIIYTMALATVVKQLDDIGNILFYALGFACGNYVGGYIEEKMALGDITAQIILKSNENVDNIIEDLRDNGFGVTVLEGQGKEGVRKILKITLKRKNINNLRQIIDNLDNEAFITVSDAKYIKGGYFTKITKIKKK
ncbi:DUF2179 domain-containing protein [Clostridiisalibacter paucivorans]|uniref:DUF2179 domain-containing protein n=1 Tax=Clostridiisalibacter paucivorans TaxID=408753 RepID=UPI00047EB2F3|nr:DUF2179 domain-containing protein [Clostridiisalibacter paucivorans]